MTLSFNLLYEPWIPVLLSADAGAGSGGQREMGLAEVLTRAHEIREIADPSPLVTVALHRLLLAVLHRVFAPTDEHAWEQLWRAGRLPEAPVVAYLDDVADRFDLFHARRPCGQTPGLPERLADPVARLAVEQATGRQATVWDHHCDAERGPVSAAQAARWLFAHHAFCLSGCCGDGQGLRGVAAGPLAHTAVFMACGGNLWETLLLNLAPADTAAVPGASAAPPDLPAWERDAPPDPDAPPTGMLDLLTWQPRSILLLPGPQFGPSPTVDRAIVMPGRQFSCRHLPCDPMLAYCGHERRPGAWGPLRLQPGDSWWSHLARMARPSCDRWRRPLVLELLAHRAARGVLPAAASADVAVMGLAGDRARVDLWRRDFCRLPAVCLTDENRLADLEMALEVAHRTHRILGEHLIAAGLRPTATEGLSSRECGHFWSGLQHDLALLPGRLAGSVGERTDALHWWSRSCFRQAFRIWSAGTDRLGRRGGAWRRQAQLQDRLAVALRRALSDPLGVGESVDAL